MCIANLSWFTSPLGRPILDDADQEYVDDFGIPLIVALRRLFVNYDRGVLLSGNKWISVAQCESGGYAIINSNAVNVNNALDGKNNARAFVCKTTKEMVTASFKASAFYDLYPLTFVNIYILMRPLADCR